MAAEHEQQAASVALDLESELSCPICTDLLYQPLTLLDCLHTFCGSCLKEWFSCQRRNAEVAAINDRHRRARRVKHTCPACRARVRDTKVDAKVNTLLDVLLQLDPSKGKSEEEKQRINATYRPGDPVLHDTARSNGEARSDGAFGDWRAVSGLLSRMNIIEAPDRDSAVIAHSQSHPMRLYNPTEAMPVHAGTHQPSLVSLLSSSDNASISEQDLYRHARRAGLLPDIDQDLTPEQEEELSRQLAEDYQRRHRHRQQHRPATGEHQSREPDSSATRRAERNRRPLLEPPPLSRIWHSNEPTRLRSASRHRSSSSNTRADGRPASGDSSRRLRTSSSQRPSRPEPSSDPSTPRSSRRGEEASTSPAQERTERRRHSHRHGGGSSSARPPSSRSGDGLHGHHRLHHPNVSDTPPSTARSTQQGDPSPESRQHRQHSQERGSSRLGSAPDLWVSPLRSSPYRFMEPHIKCEVCKEEDIQYKIHKICLQCYGDSWAICNRCFLLAHGCPHWYGFGTDAQLRYEQAAIDNGRDVVSPPHYLLSRRYRQPPEGEVTPDGMTNSDPSERLEEGVFCNMCHAFADACYWKCEQCNEGEWGFCNSCVNKGICCTHPLLPIGKIHDFARDPVPPIIELSWRQRYKPLNISTLCNICRKSIPAVETRFHCSECEGGDYDICNDCYTRPQPSFHISREDGPEGWRRCFQGHRMVVVAFQADAMGWRRVIVKDIVGGHALRDTDSNGQLRRWGWLEASNIPNAGVRIKTLRRRNGMNPVGQPSADTAGTADATHTPRFPPSGGVGLRVLALWGYYPAEHIQDEIFFPQKAEITEAENINNDWYWGCYAGQRGLFPGRDYVRVLEEVTNSD